MYPQEVWSNETVLHFFLGVYQAVAVLWNPMLQEHKTRNAVAEDLSLNYAHPATSITDTFLCSRCFYSRWLYLGLLCLAPITPKVWRLYKNIPNVSQLLMFFAIYQFRGGCVPGFICALQFQFGVFNGDNALACTNWLLNLNLAIHKSPKIKRRRRLCSQISLLLLGIALISKFFIKRWVEIQPHIPGLPSMEDERPLPSLTMDIYLFNWTNAKDICNSSVKPKFEEVGPYTFKEVKEKS
ncbi:hypothetical protein NQ317_012663 [Molorchus minor]|uniref:Uncharacterized protein n=1 Tax=Molorchus minor TaxID=1323400 RepID=A0ABQ9JLL3_9CUCU|nr:hypothetical protein NQ317_012663 [Molorchus minor]